MGDYLSLREAAKLVGASTSLLQKRCKDGTIPAIRVGNRYRIDRSDLEAWVSFAPSTLARELPLDTGDVETILRQIDRWLSFLALRKLAPTTIANYKAYLLSHLRRIEAGGLGVGRAEHLFQRRSLVAGFEKMEGKSHSLRLNTVNALLSLGRFLVSENELQIDALATVKEFRPIRGPEPRRTSLKAPEIPRLFHAIAVRTNDPVENVTVAAAVGLMLYAGLRVSEACALRLSDVNLEERVIVVRHGKGGKDRHLGARRELIGLLKSYLMARPSRDYHVADSVERNNESYLLLRPDGRPWNKDQLGRRMRHLSKLIGVDLTCHGLRRTFATVASAKGHSVNYLRIALGHSSIAVTQSYLRTTENEVVEAMKNW